MKNWFLALCVAVIGLSWGRAETALSEKEEFIAKQIRLINQIPEDQLSDKADPAFSILRVIYDKDAPDFLTLRKLLGDASIRGKLNPSARCLFAGVVSARWDTFSLSGNLYLSGLRSANADLRDKARKKLVHFIQPAHIPTLIETLKVPGPNVLAYEILQEVTGMRIDPGVQAWMAWWKQGGSKADLIGHLIGDTKNVLDGRRVHPFEQERFWYLPEGIDEAQTTYSQRSDSEQRKISDWNAWVRQDVRKYVEDWARVKPTLDRLIHQPDPRVSRYLESLVGDPGIGDYASVVLAWRSSTDSLDAIRQAYQATPTIGRALARGSLGDKTALVDLLKILERHQAQPMSYKIMDDEARGILSILRTVGVVSAEQAFELLVHRNFAFDAAATPKEKKKAFKNAKTWLQGNAAKLTLDRRRGFYTVGDNDK